MARGWSASIACSWRSLALSLILAWPAPASCGGPAGTGRVGVVGNSSGFGTGGGGVVGVAAGVPVDTGGEGDGDGVGSAVGGTG